MSVYMRIVIARLVLISMLPGTPLQKQKLQGKY